MLYHIYSLEWPYILLEKYPSKSLHNVKQHMPNDYFTNVPFKFIAANDEKKQ